MRRPLSLMALCLVAVVASRPVRADDSRRLDLARQLMAQVHETETVRASVPLFADDMRKVLAQQGQTSEDAEAFVARYRTRLAAEAGRYSDLMAEAYARAFTEEDLAAAIAFNATPVGQRFIAQRPALTQASFLTMRTFGQDVVREVLEEMEREKASGTAPGKL